MRQLRQDLCAFVGNELENDVMGLGFDVQDARRAFIPILTSFPCCPAPLRIKAVQLIRPAAHIGIEGELNWAYLLLKDVLGEDAGAAPAVEEMSVEARVSLLKHK